ncbi:Hsp20/alpha crystallin family protein [Flavobacterium alkalisoli]|uniref:Hsp20/alpha crystallin family protein n=1 Tax=Flavobacterium alkalisoli TaxID=2602769 RepID=A0A5B9FWQ5_9FLAO|nr:Hsp20/alpha crystallin family protein [Flavobacterium alkalisoli]QEE51404.1 Hsp20/alpha crystallin family protein [Flavobacterium alkalisoli]
MNLVKRNNTNGFPFVMDEIFKDLMGGTQYVNKVTAPVNIKETENNFLVELMAPGLKKEDFNVELDNDLLTISSEVKTEKTEGEEGKFTRKEFSFSSFKRSFTLPETVNQEAITASYDNGILKLTLPKKEEALPKEKRLIDIS